jgi:RNA polymerase sigma-70 factor (ECF subfamily)
MLLVSVAANQVAIDLGAALQRRASRHESLEQALIRDYPGMTALLLRYTADPQLAADLLQDAIVTTLAKLASGAAQPTHVIAGYVFRTALNHLRNHRRNERLRGIDRDTAPPAQESASPEEHSARLANARTVRRVLQGMASPRDREVLLRLYLHEQSKQQICADLGVSEHDFSRIVDRARARLRLRLEGAGLRRSDLLSLITTIAILEFLR